MSNIPFRMALALAAAAVAIPSTGIAQAFPQKPIMIVAAYPADGVAG